MSFTFDWSPLSESLAHALGFDLVTLMTESMPQFVSDRKIKKLIKRDMPFREQFDFAFRLRHKQDLFKKRLTHFQVAESGTIWI